MRIDLGMVQMELTGRPDGERPQGHESLLEFYEAEGEAGDRHRHIILTQLGRLCPVDARGTSVLPSLSLRFPARAIRSGRARHRAKSPALRFVGRHAARQRDKLEFDRYRPYVQMMHTRALASQSLKDGDHSAALAQIDDGIEAIRRFLRDYQQEERETECSELRFLVRWRREVERERPIDLLEKLEQQLELSVVLEDYEEAARLRDQIRRLRNPIAKRQRRLAVREIHTTRSTRIPRSRLLPS